MVVVWLHILGPYRCMHVALFGSRLTAQYIHTMQNFDLGSVCLLVDVMRAVTQTLVRIWSCFGPISWSSVTSFLAACLATFCLFWKCWVITKFSNSLSNSAHLVPYNHHTFYKLQKDLSAFLSRCNCRAWPWMSEWTVFVFKLFRSRCTKALGLALCVPCSITKLEEPCSFSEVPDGPNN